MSLPFNHLLSKHRCINILMLLQKEYSPIVTCIFQNGEKTFLNSYLNLIPRFFSFKQDFFVEWTKIWLSWLALKKGRKMQAIANFLSNHQKNEYVWTMLLCSILLFYSILLKKYYEIPEVKNRTQNSAKLALRNRYFW